MQAAAFRHAKAGSGFPSVAFSWDGPIAQRLEQATHNRKWHFSPIGNHAESRIQIIDLQLIEAETERIHEDSKRTNFGQTVSNGSIRFGFLVM